MIVIKEENIMAFNWEQSAFLGYMVEQYEKEQQQKSSIWDTDDDDEEEDSSSSNDNYWPF